MAELTGRVLGADLLPDAHARHAPDHAGRPALRGRRRRGQTLSWRSAWPLPSLVRRQGGEDHPSTPASASARPLRTTWSCLRRLPELVALGRAGARRHQPQVVSAASFTGRGLDELRSQATLATNVLAYERGARIFRVHDVAPSDWGHIVDAEDSGAPLVGQDVGGDGRGQPLVDGAAGDAPQKRLAAGPDDQRGGPAPPVRPGAPAARGCARRSCQSRFPGGPGSSPR